MNFVIKHEITGRMRIHIKQNTMTLREADLLLYYLSSLPQVKEAKVYNRTADAVICYEGKRGDLIKAVGVFRYDREEVQALVPEHTGRALNQKYQEKLINKVAIRAVT